MYLFREKFLREERLNPGEGGQPDLHAQQRAHQLRDRLQVVAMEMDGNQEQYLAERRMCAAGCLVAEVLSGEPADPPNCHLFALWRAAENIRSGCIIKLDFKRKSGRFPLKWSNRWDIENIPLPILSAVSKYGVHTHSAIWQHCHRHSPNNVRTSQQCAQPQLYNNTAIDTHLIM